MGTKTTSLPDGFGIETADWHFKKFVQFTKFKQEIGEPSPHLTVVGHMSKNMCMEDKLWLIGCFASVYCLPTAQVLFNFWTDTMILEKPVRLESWLTKHWKGIVTRTERRAIRTPEKLARCLVSYATWMRDEFPRIQELQYSITDPREYYDAVWDSANTIYSFGRYIVIRMIEGLRRYCGIPAMIYDIRSMGGWSPKKCLCYLYPDYTDVLLTDTAENNKIIDGLVEDLLERVNVTLPSINYYVLAAMLCEYKGAYENRHQYTGWTIDQEPLLYDKVIAYWGDRISTDELWAARKDAFPHQVLGEISGWNGTRWDLAKALRDYGYNWSDLRYDYLSTLETGDFSAPVKWSKDGTKSNK